ncbi:MAG TPA: hypothetical protein VFO55_02135 [Gemmatimonadaceae bacterium]|nr:hypothetical protein [Gemmatimonadaceae bacterium]
MIRLAAITLLLAHGLLPAQPTWSLSASPVLDIGDERNTQTQFDGVTGILRMPGGEIVVANGMSQELRVFSRTGAWLRTVARAGSQPGDLRALNRVWRAGDTIVVAELLPMESNLHRYSTTGFLSRERVGASNAGGIQPLDRFPDGRFVITATPRPGRQRPAGRVFLDSQPLGLLSTNDLARPLWIGSLVSERMMAVVSGPGRNRRLGSTQVPFGRSTQYAVSGDRLWVGDSETGVVTQFSSAGREIGRFVVPIAARQVDSTAIRRQRQAGVTDAMNWDDRMRMDAFYSVPLPRQAPRFSRFLPGPAGEMWIEMYQEEPGATRSYLVVGRSGETLGRVTMPAGAVPHEAGLDYVLAVRRDSEGIEHVVQYSLKR